MRLTALLILYGCLTVSARGFSQNIHLDVKNASLEQVFAHIKKQTGYGFIYYKEDLQKSEKITIKLSSSNISEVLQKILKDQPLSYKIVDKTIVIARKKATSQAVSDIHTLMLPPPIDIRGKLVNENGEPVVASIQIKGTKRGTTTDDNGEFVLTGVDPSTTLVITGIGIESLEYHLDGQSTVVIRTKSKTTALKQVSISASNGYQKIPKERATGSFYVLNESDIQNQPGKGILERLTNFTSGLVTDKFAGRPPITIRGLSTINGPKDPLIILDNFPYEGDINNINPMDVESVTVLKDAAASSIWGARAGNGVIVITTKKAAHNQELKVSLQANMTMQEKSNLFYRPQASTAEYIELEQFLFSKGYFTANETNVGRPALSPVVETLIAIRDGKMVQQEGLDYINQLKTRDVRKQFLSDVYQQALRQQYTINVQGGTGKLASYFSFGYDNNKSDLSERDERFSLRSDNRLKLVKGIVLTANLVYTENKTISGQTPFGMTMSGISKPYYPYTDLSEPFYLIRQPYIDTTGAGKLLDWRLYPLLDGKLSRTTTKRTDILLNAGAEISFLKRFRLDLKLQVESEGTNTQKENKLESYYTRDLVNRFSQINRTTGIVSYPVPKEGILDASNGSVKSISGRAQLNYNYARNNHNVTTLAGFEIRNTHREEISKRLYGYNENFASVIPVDNVNLYPTYIYGFQQRILDNSDFSNITDRFVSSFANVAYTYKSRYTVSGSARADASNIFGLETNNKWRPLWSAGASWNLSSEPFFQSATFPFVKLRLTYGYSGNIDNSKSPYTLIRNGNSVTSLPTMTYAQIVQFPNPLLRWEKVRSINGGIDFRIKDFMEGSLEVYEKHASDLYGSVPIDYTTGVGLRIIRNIAKLNTRGVDLILRTKILQGKFAWNTTLLSSYNANKVAKNYTVATVATFASGVGVTAVEGRPVYALHSYKWYGLDATTGNPVGLWKGQTSQDYGLMTGASATLDDLQYDGPLTPTHFGSLLNEWSFKNFYLQTMLSYKAGHYFRRSSVGYSTAFAGLIIHGDYSKRWQKPGDEKSTNVPSMIYPITSARENFYTYSEVLAEKGDLVRFEFIRLGYNLNLPPSKGIKQLQVYLHVANLGLIWTHNKFGVDPDYAKTGIPPSKAYTIGIQLNY